MASTVQNVMPNLSWTQNKASQSKEEQWRNFLKFEHFEGYLFVPVHRKAANEFDLFTNKKTQEQDKRHHHPSITLSLEKLNKKVVVKGRLSCSVHQWHS